MRFFSLRLRSLTPEAASTRPLPALRTEFFLHFAILLLAAVLATVGGVGLFLQASASNRTIFLLGALLAADVAVFIVFGAYQLRKLFLQPLDEALPAIEAIAAGDLARRVPSGASREFADLADRVNRMTDRLLDERTQLVHVEKLASIGRLAAGVAHEIGNPLGAINGYTHILRRSLAGNTEALEAVYGLERESARVDRIVRGLLDYARKRPTTPTPIDVNDCVRSVVALLTDQGVLRPLRVTMRLDPDSVMTVGERHEIEQVLVNLLLNAVDALGGQGRVEVRTRRTTIDTLHVPSPRREGDPPAVNHARQSNPRLRGWLAAGDRPKELVQLVIADSGPGIPAGEEERIFDPFYTTKEPGKGTGLGLAIVARIVDNQRGVVWVQRAREGGAAFMVLLPRHQASVVAAPGTLAAPPAKAVAR